MRKNFGNKPWCYPQPSYDADTCHMNVKILLVTISLLITNALSSYAYNLGPYKVISTDDSTPIEYVCVADKARTFSLMSDSLGVFTLPQELSANDTIFIFRIGYVAKRYSISDLPNTISLNESPTNLVDVVVTPLKKKKLGDLVVPNKIQRSLIDLRHKTNLTDKSRYLFNKEAARKFKIKNDFILRKIRVAISNQEPLDFIIIIYRRTDSGWVAVHNKPIVARVGESHREPFVVELDVSESVEPQPKGEYMVAIMMDERFTIWGKSPWLEDGYHRNPLDNNWQTKDVVPGIELHIEY